MYPGQNVPKRKRPTILDPQDPQDQMLPDLYQCRQGFVYFALILIYSGPYSCCVLQINRGVNLW